MPSGRPPRLLTQQWRQGTARQGRLQGNGSRRPTPAIEEPNDVETTEQGRRDYRPHPRDWTGRGTTVRRRRGLRLYLRPPSGRIGQDRPPHRPDHPPRASRPPHTPEPP